MVSTKTDDHPCQLNLLSLAAYEMSTSQSMVMLCGWEMKANMAHSTRGLNVWWRVKL